ncbi:uncharacterized protein LOC125472766 [Pyrus x bretschneideri]|uniref:uncharacterized protein LOC125472766 n=1 Tax=Pyrus x bretschneideri TaxID=225117 RepID=UPI00202DCDDE|nr:uncharacterized protein LOC125472766 [Pyrus x bretschneideri]
MHGGQRCKWEVSSSNDTKTCWNFFITVSRDDAAWVAMLFARDLEAACVEFAGDTQMVIAALQQNSEDDISRLGHVIDDARHFLHSIPHDCLSLNRRLTGLHTVWFSWIFLWMDKCFVIVRKEKKFRSKFFLAVWLLIKVGKLERVGILGQAFQIRVNCSSIWECFGALNLIACLLVIACKLPRDGETDMRMWVARAELVHDWRRTEKGAGCIQEEHKVFPNGGNCLKKKQRNEIRKIKDSYGFWWNEGEGLEQAFVQDFKLQFSCDFPPTLMDISSIAYIIDPCNDNHHNELLLKPIENIEIWDAVKRIGALKAPGPNGIGHECWDIIKDSVSVMVKEFFENCTILRLIDHTNIALIPKVENPEVVSNYRPISLCNVSYKIITKIIIKRLKPLIDHCISGNQGAFSPGCSIHNNILIAHEMFSSFKSKKGRTRAMGIKLDLEKAYDYLNWEYIR